MIGIRLIIIMAAVGGVIAYIADKMGSKIGKRKMSVFGLRPRHTSILLTVLSGILISIVTIGVVAIASQSARTALFGMEKLQKELVSLNEEKTVAALALAQANEDVSEKNGIISELDVKIKESVRENVAMEQWLAQAKNEVTSLTAARDWLTREVQQLEATTKQLHEGIITMREGRIFYRAGEVVYSGVLLNGRSHEENVAQITWLLQNANEAILQRLGVAEEKNPPQAILLTKETVDEAVAIMDGSSRDMLCRVRTVANIILGELVACDLEITENHFIYANNALVYAEKLDLAQATASYDVLLLKFLNNVNHTAVSAGVLPDPLTGKVGSIDASTMIAASNEMRRLGGTVMLKAYAQGDISTAGPVRIRIEVKGIHG